MVMAMFMHPTLLRSTLLLNQVVCFLPMQLREYEDVHQLLGFVKRMDCTKLLESILVHTYALVENLHMKPK